jgi:hypothetical protein
LTVDSRAFLGELVCLPLIGGGETLLRAFCSSALWQIYETLHLPLKVQECRFATPSQGAGITVLSKGGWATHSSALSLQTQHKLSASVEPGGPVGRWVSVNL